jgi:hypothetical protein
MKYEDNNTAIFISKNINVEYKIILLVKTKSELN